jgi:Flp pilus assembly protein TadG
MRRPFAIRRLWRGEQGGVALEFAIVAAVFIVVTVGLIEFGRVLQVRNEMAFAMDRGARMVHLDENASQETIRTAIRDAFRSYDRDKLQVEFASDSNDAVVVQLSYPLDIFIPGYTGTFNIGMPPRRVPRVEY